VTLEIATKARVAFPLYLRVPKWCRTPHISVNGTSVALDDAATPGFVLVNRTWSTGDRVELTLPMELSIRRWEKNHDSVSVDRGPLTFSLQIQEDYRRAGGTDRWPSWEIHPASPWNYGLALDPDNATRSFTVVKRDWPADDRPFTHSGAPIAVKAKGRRIPQWQLDQNGLVEELQQSPALTNEPLEELTLIPMGAARLRISAFPVAEDSPEGFDWVRPEPSEENENQKN
jgi:hypothetical protein